MIDIKHTRQDIDFLLSPKAIRERTSLVYERCLKGETHFKINEDKFEDLSDFVIEVIKENYPDLEIPFHSRWRHVNAGEIDRVKLLKEHISKISEDTKNDLGEDFPKLRRMLDFIIISVLVDAGAGNKWKFKEEKYGLTTSRSEGLCVASFYLYKDLIKDANAENLQNISKQEFSKVFQVSDSNPLVGLEGRLNLLHTLAEVCKGSQYFKTDSPGSFIYTLIDKETKSISALDVLTAVLTHLGPIWPSRLKLGETSLGDCWHYSPLGPLSTQSLVPFHKLSQWLTYSLFEPIMEAGIEIKDVDKMTGLCEYRNGGLLLDYNYIELRDEKLNEIEHAPDSDLMIEWRAITLITLDKLGESIQKKLGKNPSEFPLAKVLEGGTWWAGRKLANKLRKDGAPPLKIKSDGTVF